MLKFQTSEETDTKILITLNNSFFTKPYDAITFLIHALKLLKQVEASVSCLNKWLTASNRNS